MSTFQFLGLPRVTVTKEQRMAGVGNSAKGGPGFDSKVAAQRNGFHGGQSVSESD